MLKRRTGIQIGAIIMGVLFLCQGPSFAADEARTIKLDHSGTVPYAGDATTVVSNVQKAAEALAAYQNELASPGFAAAVKQTLGVEEFLENRYARQIVNALGADLIDASALSNSVAHVYVVAAATGKKATVASFYWNGRRAVNRSFEGTEQIRVAVLSPVTLTNQEVALRLTATKRDSKTAETLDVFTRAFISVVAGTAGLDDESAQDDDTGETDDKEQSIEYFITYYKGKYSKRAKNETIDTVFTASLIDDNGVEAAARQNAEIKKAVEDGAAIVKKVEALERKIPSSDNVKDDAAELEARKKLRDSLLAKRNKLLGAEKVLLAGKAKHEGFQLVETEYYSFSMAYAFDDDTEVTFDSDNGRIVAKEESKLPVYMTINWHLLGNDPFADEDSVNSLRLTDPCRLFGLNPHFMFGFRASVEEFEPMVGFGVGFRVFNIPLGAWIGVAYQREENLKGGASVGGETAGGDISDKEDEVEEVYGISARFSI